MSNLISASVLEFHRRLSEPILLVHCPWGCNLISFEGKLNLNFAISNIFQGNLSGFLKFRTKLLNNSNVCTIDVGYIFITSLLLDFPTFIYYQAFVKKFLLYHCDSIFTYFDSAE